MVHSWNVVYVSLNHFWPIFTILENGCKMWILAKNVLILSLVPICISAIKIIQLHVSYCIFSCDIRTWILCKSLLLEINNLQSRQKKAKQKLNCYWKAMFNTRFFLKKTNVVQILARQFFYFFQNKSTTCPKT